MNIIDKTVEYISPETALRRDTARKVLAAQRAYEAAQPSRLRKKKTDPGSGDAIVERAGESLRLQARHLDENHDLASGVLDVLANNGELATEVNDQLMELWEDWIRFPEVTGECHWNHMLRLIARHWFRDGEVLLKHVEGTRRDLDHGTIVPYSLEMIEADLLPFDLNDQKRRIVHGVEKNAWRRPRAYHLYKDHPGDAHERLKEFGIKSRSQGDQVTFTFQGVSTTVRKNTAEIEGYLRSIGDVQFAGAMEEQAKTLNVALSNMGDSFSKLVKAIGDAGLTELLTWLANKIKWLAE